MKKFIAMIAITLIALTLCSCVKTDNNIDNYSDDIKAYEASSFMPGLDNIGKYNDVEYFSRKDESIFPEYSMQLVVKYNEEEFLKEKEILNTAYTYLELPLIILARPKINLHQEGYLCLDVIEETYKNAIASGDMNVYYLSGTELMALSGDDGIIDSCHPNDYGFYSMVEAISRVLKRII